MKIKFGIIIVSTSCSKRPDLDTAGPILEENILKAFPLSAVTFKDIIADDKEQIIDSLRTIASDGHCDVLFTVGGTGFAASDVTPEATKLVIDKEAPGLVHAILSRSLEVTHMAMLSRPVCGIKKNTIIMNFPGSEKAAVECFSFVKDAIPHAVALIKEDHLKIKETHRSLQSPNPVIKQGNGVFRSRTSEYPMITVEEAQIQIRGIVTDAIAFEKIDVEKALGRVLAENVKALKPIPSFPASIKDGYAVRTEDGPGRRQVRSVIAAGDILETRELRRNEVDRISTGAPIPAGADAVVQIEDTELLQKTENGKEEAFVKILVDPVKGQDIRQIGSDVEQGSVVLQKFSRLSAACLGVFTMLGRTTVKVFMAPVVSVISTGNEICDAREPLRPGQIHDSNKLTLLSLLKTYGYNALDGGIARDSHYSVKHTLERAFEKSDIIISSGGVSMGEFDLMKEVLIESFEATIHFGRVNMKPGKPTVFMTLTYMGKRKIVFALPGNPVSCCVTCLLFVIPTLKRLEGDKEFDDWPVITATLEDTVINRDSRPEYVRVTVRVKRKGQIVARSTGNQISSRLNSMVNANGLLLVEGKTQLDPHSIVPVMLFGSLV